MPGAHAPCAHVPPHPSAAPQALPAQLGVHPHVPVAPAPPQVSGAVHPFPVQHGCPFPPQTPHVVPQVVPDEHTSHRAPPLPHAASFVPAAQPPLAQHPEHELVSQTQPPLTQCRPCAQLPVMHTPPQPSLAPHTLSVQLGVQPQMPLTPAPPHVSGEAHSLPGQHAWPLPPQVPQSAVPHAVPAEHTWHRAPPWPHAVLLVPSKHAPPAQHPGHDVASHRHAPPTQRCPLPHAPSTQTPRQPSLAPHALPAHVGAQAPVPQTLGVPPPPQVEPTGHPPQSTTRPQSRTCPHLFAHVAGLGEQDASRAPSTASTAPASARRVMSKASPRS
jgi:hypothetical protein